MRCCVLLCGFRKAGGLDLRFCTKTKQCERVISATDLIIAQMILPVKMEFTSGQWFYDIRQSGTSNDKPKARIVILLEVSLQKGSAIVSLCCF